MNERIAELNKLINEASELEWNANNIRSLCYYKGPIYGVATLILWYSEWVLKNLRAERGKEYNNLRGDIE